MRAGRKWRGAGKHGRQKRQTERRRRMDESETAEEADAEKLSRPNCGTMKAEN